jgi:hypothetical protein
MSPRNVSAKTAPAPSVDVAPIHYPHDTEDRLCDVAGSIQGITRMLEKLPDEIMDSNRGYLVHVLQMLQVLEREVRAINHGAVELMEVAHG